MTRLEDRQILMRDIAQARADGARLAPACALAGFDPRTLQRWKTGDGLSNGDRRPDADRPAPSHALSEAEQARIIAVANESRFSETPPARIVPALADVSTSPASRAFIVCCALVAKCTGVGVPSRRASQGRRALISPLAPARSGAGM
jgi:putative transposase